MATRAYIGTSGFTYPHWKGVFYPDNVPQKRWLEYYAQHFGTVELNNTFYAMPRPETCATWRARTGPDFLFAVKLNRVLTHRFRLLRAREWLDRYIDAVDHLGDKLGPVLVQLPPKWHADPQRLDDFLQLASKRLRWCLEFRDPAWLCEDVYRVLRAHGAGLVIHDLLPDHPREITADFTYLRFHGPGGKGDMAYDAPQLKEAAREIRAFLKKKLTVFAYFNNDVHGHAVQNAQSLKQLLE